MASCDDIASKLCITLRRPSNGGKVWLAKLAHFFAARRVLKVGHASRDEAATANSHRRRLLFSKRVSVRQTADARLVASASRTAGVTLLSTINQELIPMAKKQQAPSEPTWEFVAHATTPLYGTGTAGDAARLCAFMNEHRILNRWQVYAVANGGHPMLDIAAEVARHMEARAA